MQQCFCDSNFSASSSSLVLIEKGFERLLVVCGTYYLCGIMDVMVGSIRGIGYSVMPMIVSLIGACGLRIIWLKTFFLMDMFHRPFYIYVTYPVSWIVTIMAHVVCYYIVRKRIGIKNYSE